jgi:hypothetical protein
MLNQIGRFLANRPQLAIAIALLGALVITLGIMLLFGDLPDSSHNLHILREGVSAPRQ